MILDAVLFLTWLILIYIALDLTAKGLSLGLREGGKVITFVMKVLVLPENMNSIIFVKGMLTFLFFIPILEDSLRTYWLIAMVIGTAIYTVKDYYTLKKWKKWIKG